MKILKTAFRYKTFIVGFIMVLSVVLIGVFEKQIAPFTSEKIDLSMMFKAPDAKHIFGTDQLGRDIFSRIVYGARYALTLGIVISAITGAVGIALGLIAGFFGKVLDKIIAMFVDLLLALPSLIIIIAFITLVGPGMNGIIAAVCLVSWAGMARLVSIKTLAVKNLPYIDAAKVSGENNFNILFRYILPNISPIIIVILSTMIPANIMLGSALSFLGIGVQPPAPEWGTMVTEGMAYIMDRPWMSLLPGAVLTYAILGFNLLGEGLRDLLDPTLKS